MRAQELCVGLLESGRWDGGSRCGARLCLQNRKKWRGVCQLYVAAGLGLAFMDLSCRCSMILVIDVEIGMCMHGLEVVAKPEYDQCLPAKLASSLFMLQALVGNRSIWYMRARAEHVHLFSYNQC